MEEVAENRPNPITNVRYESETGLAQQQEPLATIRINGAISPVFLPCGSVDDIPPPKPDFLAPPPYELVTKLPSYEEVEREKSRERQPALIAVGDVARARNPAPFTSLLELDSAGVTNDVDTSLLGTDFMFYIAFFVAFIFNWIGFLLVTCFCNTIAARYGALSGFGLSLAKWTLIVKHSTDFGSRENGWLWWLVMVFGLVICIRAIIQYLSVKRGWHLLSANHQERLLFFY